MLRDNSSNNGHKQIAYLVVTEAAYSSGRALFYSETEARRYIDTEREQMNLESFVQPVTLNTKSDATYHLVVSEECYGGLLSDYLTGQEQILFGTSEELIDRKVDETGRRIDFISAPIQIRQDKNKYSIQQYYIESQYHKSLNEMKSA